MDARICVSLFGSMSVGVGNELLIPRVNRPTKPWELMVLLLLHRNERFSNQQLMDMLWEEEIDNPAGALKNAVYSLRKLLQPIDASIAFITTDNGCYNFTSEVGVDVDVVEFETAAEDFWRAEHEREQNLELAKRAVRLYGGDMLPGLSKRRWVGQYNSYMYRLYERTVLELARILTDRGQPEDLEEVLDLCNRAVQIEPLQEQFYIFIFRAMQGLDMRKAILNFYPVVANLFFDELGISLSAQVKDIYHKMFDVSEGERTDVHQVQQDLTEKAEDVDGLNGAYYCEYDTFRRMYHIMVRSAERTGEKALVLLATLSAVPGKKVSKQEKIDEMSGLKEMFAAVLRKGDVFSRYSRNQYVVMLFVRSFQDELAVKKRIHSAFGGAHKGKMALYLTSHSVDTDK